MAVLERADPRERQGRPVNPTDEAPDELLPTWDLPLPTAPPAGDSPGRACSHGRAADGLARGGSR